uniref:TTF-type domain-containing protein n=1 Tax=Cyprinus carpio TaxID=7962 RepID=A0A8C1K3Y1_CYPCA
MRTELVRRGPFKPGLDFSFPKDKSRRAFHSGLLQRKLSNGEKIHRSWLTYSIKNNAVYCFCCKLFSTKYNKIIKEGVNDWSNINAILKHHESSPEHTQNMIKWRELDLRLSQGQTLDQIQMTIYEAERKRWRDVLTRLISITQSLAERNLAFRGSSEKLFQPDNGNFLKEVELLAKFDPIMENHLSKIKDGQTHAHYLGQHTQNELIQIVSGKILEAIVTQIRDSKYFSIILDCTPDISHQEQMSIILRSVALRGKPETKEHFLGFVNVEATTGLNLSTVILNKLNELKISFEDCRGQAFDNGANMKGKNQGLQARLLRRNPRAVFVPCGAHTLNLVIADAAKSSKDAVGFFGHVQKLFTFFSAGTQRWSVLKKHVKITMKSWSDTRWESRLKSVHAIRHQASEVREALLEARQTINDPVAKVEAQALAEEVGSYRFLICCVVWCEILTITNIVNKLLQSASMQLDIAVNLISNAKASLTTYRDTGFSEAQTTATSICEVMNVEAVLKEKRLRNSKRHFSYEAPDEPMTDALKNLEVNFFNIVVDSAVTSMDERFETLNQVKSKYGVLLNFSTASQMSSESLKAHCMEVQNTLTFRDDYDISGMDLAHEIQNLPDLPSDKMTAFELL